MLYIYIISFSNNLLRFYVQRAIKYAAIPYIARKVIQFFLLIRLERFLEIKWLLFIYLDN